MIAAWRNHARDPPLILCQLVVSIMCSSLLITIEQNQFWHGTKKEKESDCSSGFEAFTSNRLEARAAELLSEEASLTPTAGRWARWWRGRCLSWWSGGTGRGRGSRGGWEAPPRSCEAQRTGRERRSLRPLCPGASGRGGGLVRQEEGETKGSRGDYADTDSMRAEQHRQGTGLSPNIQRSRHSRQITSSCHTCSRPCWAVGSRQPWASSWKNFCRLNAPISGLGTGRKTLQQQKQQLWDKHLNWWMYSVVEFRDIHCNPVKKMVLWRRKYKNIQSYLVYL